MRIGIVTPAPPRSLHGNRVTADRWSRILRELGHRVSVREGYDGEDWDLIVALHARRSAPSVVRFHRRYSDRPIFVALTGTDLYIDLPRGSHKVMKSLELATRLITLQPLAADSLPRPYRAKVRVVYQSLAVPAVSRGSTPSRAIAARTNHAHFDVFVVGHLRAIKDPFRTAMAARTLPADSRIRVEHYGRALSDAMRQRAERESRRNERYRWHGEVPHGQLMRALGRRAALLVHSSKVEGGPHAISEAIVAGVPVLATDIPGSTGLLGGDYPGLFPVGDTKTLQDLLIRAEGDTRFYGSLRRACRQVAKHFRPDRELRSWRDLLTEVA